MYPQSILLVPNFPHKKSSNRENISSFLDHHLQSLAQRVNSFMKDTNHFLQKIKSLGQLPEGAILCTIDAVGL